MALDQKSKLSFASKIAKGGKPVDLRVYYSANGIKEPTETLNQRVYHNPSQSISLSFPVGRDLYDTDWVYLSFYSETGCSMMLNVMFKDGANHIIHRKRAPAELSSTEIKEF
jgi:hypothetical protein